MYFSEFETIAYYRNPAVSKPSSEAEKPFTEVPWSALPEKVRRTIRAAGALSLEGDYPDSRKMAKIETEVAVFSGNGKSARMVARDRRVFEVIEDHVFHQRLAAVFRALEAAVLSAEIGGEAGEALLGDLPEPPELPAIPDWLEPIEFAHRPYTDNDFESVLARGAEATEALRSVVEWAANAPEAVSALPDDYALLINAFLLLGDLRDQSSFPAIVRFASTPESICDPALVDLITEELPEILARTYNGDFALIASLIENEKAYEYCRRSAVGALTLLFWDGVLPRERVASYLGELLQRPDTPENDDLWGPLVHAVADLRYEELTEPVRRSFELHLVDSGEIDEHTFRSLLKSATPPYRHIAPDEPLWYSQLSIYWLTEKFLTDQAQSSQWRREKAEEKLSHEQRKTVVGTTRDVYGRATPFIPPQKAGRNDPCPCGSGKKYKNAAARLGEQLGTRPPSGKLPRGCNSGPPNGQKGFSGLQGTSVTAGSPCFGHVVSFLDRSPIAQSVRP